MQVFTVASYYGSGSSAVTDLISEFEGVKSLTEYEFRFAQDPDGLSELEYNLIHNFNRHNSGHALKRYRKLVDYYGNHFLVRRYEPFFGNKWKKLSYKYIDSLIDFSYPGIWQYDFYDKGPWYEFWAKLPDRILSRTLWRNKPDNHFFFNKEITYASHPTEEKFIACTKAYTSSLLEAANAEGMPYMILDQLLPSSNIERHLRYFENLKVFVVDRDPRDLFILGKYVWKDGMMPDDVELFCQWYEYTRSPRKTEKWSVDQVLFVQFEDLIYRYSETVDKIVHWAGLENQKHLHPKKYLNPDISIKNTRIWEKNPMYKEEVEYIEAYLGEYLYKGE